MDELVDIIRRLVSEKGLQLLSDKRLYNIVLDLSPDFRSNIGYQKILKAIVDNDYMRTVIDTSHDSRFIVIANTAKRIRSEYWLDPTDSMKIISAISLGAGLISIDDCKGILFDKKSDTIIRNEIENQSEKRNESPKTLEYGDKNNRHLSTSGLRPNPKSLIDGIGNDEIDTIKSNESLNSDPFFDDAARAIVKTQQASISMIQRRFSIGYHRAGRLMDQLELCGIVGHAKGSQARDVLVDNECELNSILEQVHNGVPVSKIIRTKTSKIHNNSRLHNGSTSIPSTKVQYQKDSSWKGCGGCFVSIIIILLLAWTFGFFESKDKNHGNLVASSPLVYKDISFMDIILGGDYGAVLKGMRANPNINDVKVVNLKGEEYNVVLYTKSNTMLLDLDSIKEGLPLDTVITASAKLDGSIVGIFASVFNNKVIKINILTPNSDMVFLKSLLADKYGVATDSVNQASKGEGEFSYYWRFENGSVYLNYSEYSEAECMIVIKSSEIPKYNQILEEQEKVKKDSAHNMASKII